MDVAARGAGGAGGGVSAVVQYDYAAKEPDELDLVKGAIIHSIKQMPGGWWEGTLQSTGRTGMFPDNFVRVIDVNDESKVTMREKSATTNRRCKVIFSYTQVNDDELSLAVGDVIEFLAEVEEGWWRGRLKNKVGVFPSNFVTTIEPSPILASKRPPAASAVAAAAAAETKSATAAAIAAVASVSASANAASSSTKKMNRLSYHNSKEDLLSSTDDVAPSLPPKPQRDYCRVEYPYAPQNDDELELKTGDIITIISMELPDKGWWKGELHGKVGVFPDNFVKLLAPSEAAHFGGGSMERSSIEILGTRMANFINTFIFSPLNDTQQTSHRTAKAAHAAANANVNSSGNSSSSAHVAAAPGASAPAGATTTTKAFIKKSGSSSSTQSSNRKDSFGSRDSLNDILSETGLPSGNVAAQRKSLENKNLDLSNAPDASSRLGLKKQQLLHQQHQQHMQDTKSLLTNNGNVTVTTTTTSIASSSSSSSSAMSSSAAATSELRKSLENLDDKTKPPPPVLTKKPTVPNKKSSSGVTSNFFSGFVKPKSKNADSKLTTAASHDYADGIASSKVSPSGGSDNAPGVLMRRAATIAVEDSDFDRVERASMLPDMRAGRVKAPKRRPPSAAINVIGESNNNNSIYLNGSGVLSVGGEVLAHDDGKPHSSDDNSTGEDQLAKPKPWEKKKAPWMDELKASQVKKKTSPNVEPRTIAAGGGTSSVADRTSKLLGEDAKISSSSNNYVSSVTSATSSNTSTTTSTNSSASAKVQSTSISSSVMQQSMIVESSQQLLKKEFSAGSTNDVMAKSMSSKYTTDSATSTTGAVAAPAGSSVDDVRTRPNSLSIRNQNVSPLLRGGSEARSAMRSSASPAHTATNANETASSSTNSNNASQTVTSTATSATTVNNHHTSDTNVAAAVTKTAAAAVSGSDSVRVNELERRVSKLEATVHAQQRTIDELMRLLREETDRVKVLRGELDKYAQKQTRKGKFDNWMF